MIIESIPSSQLLNPLDLHKQLRRKDVVQAKVGTVINNGKTVGMSGRVKLDWATWLPFAAKQYNVSPNVEDYILVPVFTIPTDLPNRNGVGFPLEQLVRFNPEFGMQAYKTFKGKPTFEEHDNEDYTKAKGVIADVFLKKMAGYGIWKLLELLTFDRTRDPDLCRDILKGDMNSYSMGAWVDSYTCSYCGAEMGKCGHLHPKAKVDFYQLGDTLVYRKVVNPVGFETSAVRIPAYTVAVDTGVMSLNDADVLEPRVRKPKEAV